jgi:hypothetical protein
MPQVQVDVPEELDKKLNLYKIRKGMNRKDEVIVFLLEQVLQDEH